MKHAGRYNYLIYFVQAQRSMLRKLQALPCPALLSVFLSLQKFRALTNSALKMEAASTSET
jgi:hypothetical protein